MRSLVILSGGQDSTTCLYREKSFGNCLYAITFDYNQRHRMEVEAAKKIASLAQVENHEVINLSDILISTSPLTDHSVQVKQYENVEEMKETVEPTFVPARNSLFLTIAMNRAMIHHCEKIVIGISQVDYGGYPDCRLEYIQSISKSLNLGVFGENKKQWIPIESPLLFLSKKETVELALKLSGCLEALALTHTCYRGDSPPCGKCHSCLLRQQGFVEADIPDPLLEKYKGEKNVLR
jgi:7-cyano-7-deazaguanine synthase